jgi:hypothetical protein
MVVTIVKNWYQNRLYKMMILGFFSTLYTSTWTCCIIVFYILYHRGSMIGKMKVQMLILDIINTYAACIIDHTFVERHLSSKHRNSSLSLSNNKMRFRTKLVNCRLAGSFCGSNWACSKKRIRWIVIPFFFNVQSAISDFIAPGILDFIS